MEFSVLLPVYYKDNVYYLKEAIDSIINQSVKPNEILVLVDGKIGDNIDRLLKEYKVLYSSIFNIKYFDENRGLGKVLEEGVLSAKYDLIARMDADDIALPYRFEKQINAFESDDDLVLLGGNIQEFSYDFKEKLKERNVPQSYIDIKKYSKLRNPFNHMSVMFKKDVIIEIGNYQHMPLFEDYYLWARVIKSGYQVGNVKDTLLNVRAGDEMLAKRSGFSYLKKEISFQKSLYKIKYITLLEFVRNIIIRGLPRLLPKGILSNIYKYVLRK